MFIAQFVARIQAEEIQVDMHSPPQDHKGFSSVGPKLRLKDLRQAAFSQATYADRL